MRRILQHFSLLLILIVCTAFIAKKPITVFFAADSTVKAYKQNEWPQRGWAQPFEPYFVKQVTFENRARGGRSTKSFIKEGLWDQLLARVEKNDVVMIQFGHNDHDKRKAERYTPIDAYKENLTKMVMDVRAKKAIPILVTPIAMRSFKDGEYYDGHGDYPETMKTVAQELAVELIDLNASSGAYLQNIGFKNSEHLYMNLDPGVEKNWPDGKKDNTHLSNQGAEIMAKLVVEEIQKEKIKPLVKYIK